MGKRVIGESRERAIATLTEAFARDDLELEELEERLAKVQAAESLDAIATVVTDLVPATAPMPTRAIVPAADAQPAQRILAILGSTEQGGSWTGARRIRAMSILGSTVIDFRNARLPAGVVELEVSALLGSVEIIVPPDLAVEMHGSGILGSFEAVNRAPASPDEDRPTLRIRGLAALGSVEVITRLSGETEGDVRKRLKASEKKQELKSRTLSRATLLRGAFAGVALPAHRDRGLGPGGPDVYWVDWTTVFSSSVTGTLVVDGQPVEVVYTGERAFVQTNGGADYWSPSAGFISATVPNRPTTTDIIALNLISAKRLDFSQPVTNPLFAVVSLNGNGYRFDRDFDILGFDCGYWGCGTLTKRITPPPGGVEGDPGTTYDLIGSGEPHGVIQFIGSFSSVSWDSLTNEYWNGFTIAVTNLAVNVPPEVQVFDGAVEIFDGQAAVDFGPLIVGSSTLARTFRIENSATGPLTLGGLSISGTSSASFALRAPLPPAIAAGASVAFEVVFTSSAAGQHRAMISIASDDTDEPIFDFPVIAGDRPVTPPDAGVVADDAATADDATVAAHEDAAANEDAAIAANDDAAAAARDAAPFQFDGNDVVFHDATAAGATDAGLRSDALATTEESGCSCSTQKDPISAVPEIVLLFALARSRRRRARRS